MKNRVPTVFLQHILPLEHAKLRPNAFLKRIFASKPRKTCPKSISGMVLTNLEARIAEILIPRPGLRLSSVLWKGLCHVDLSKSLYLTWKYQEKNDCINSASKTCCQQTKSVTTQEDINTPKNKQNMAKQKLYTSFVPIKMVHPTLSKARAHTINCTKNLNTCLEAPWNGRCPNVN